MGPPLSSLPSPREQISRLISPPRGSSAVGGRSTYEEPPVSLKWFCLHTRPAREAMAAAYLADTLGLETYFPRLRDERVIRRIRRTVTRPLFPRYLFCRFDTAQHFRMVRHAADVIDVVSFGDRPVVVDDPTINDLRAWAGPVLDLGPRDDGLKPGTAVCIKDGPMQGLRAVVLRAESDRERVALLLSCLEYQAQIMISRDSLEPVAV